MCRPAGGPIETLNRTRICRASRGSDSRRVYRVVREGRTSAGIAFPSVDDCVRLHRSNLRSPEELWPCHPCVVTVENYGIVVLMTAHRTTLVERTPAEYPATGDEIHGR